jgi:hypothetical protein
VNAEDRPGWGPGGLRAAISVCFEGLAEAGSPPTPPTVTPALPTLLTVLAERDLSATFFVDAAVAEAEPLALTMVSAGRHEVAAWVGGDEDLARTVAALSASGRAVSGARARPGESPPPAPALADAGLRYLSAAGSAIREEDGIVHIPSGDQPSGVAPQARHAAMQVAVARALEGRSHLTLSFEPGYLERRDALAVFVETVDLVVGLRRAGRLWTPTLDELATWWLSARPGPR